MYGKSAMEIASKDLEKLIENAKSPMSAIEELAGVGRTTETVKGNADALAAHKAETASGVVRPHGMGRAAAQEYEEGNWTPTIQGSNVAGNNTYNNQVGRYIRVGNLITCWFTIAMSAKDAAMNGNTYIAGLPFIANSNARAGASFGRVGFLDLDDGYITLTGYASGSVIIVMEYGDGVAESEVSVNQLRNNTYLWGNIVYRI